MLHSLTVAQAIHADRVRDLERAARDRRLLDANEAPAASNLPASFVRPVPVARRNPCGDAANAPT
jgi:hypothetical protein